MAKKEQIKKDNELVVKDNDLILIGNRFDNMNITQMKIMNLIIAKFDNRLKIENIKDNDLIFNIPYQELLEKLQDSEIKAIRLKEYIKDLNKKQWKEIKDNGDWFDLNIFSYAKYEKGILEMKLNRDLVKYFLELGGNFTKYYFDNIAKFKKKYTILLYELLKANKFKKEATYSIEELLVLLKVEAKNMQVFGKFNKEILLKAQVEINETSDIHFEYSMNTKKGIYKKPQVESITFRIYDSEKNVNEYRNKIDFINFIRKNYVNQLILKGKNSQGVFELSVNGNGYLYFLNDRREMDKDQSQKLWDFLFTSQNNIEKYYTSSLLEQ